METPHSTQHHRKRQRQDVMFVLALGYTPFCSISDLSFCSSDEDDEDKPKKKSRKHARHKHAECVVV